MIHQLVASQYAATALSDIFSGELGVDPLSLSVEVLEDVCFGGEWVSLGTLAVCPRPPTPRDHDMMSQSLLAQAFQFGFFEWQVPERTDLEKRVSDVLPDLKDAQDRTKSERQLSSAVNQVVRLAVRCGLIHPLLDPMMVSRLPTMGPSVILMDTSAVLQGGMDFIGRHFRPGVRIGVPSIVHMEIVMLSDNFLKQRRERKRTPKSLLSHVLSQSGQRALVRLELEHQVERPRLGADPLRGIVQPGSDREDKNLGLQEIQRSFADRLILETAIRRRNEALPRTSVLLMTADEGLARMALAEGIEPILFRTDTLPAFFGSTVSGVPFRPWCTDGARIYSVPVATVLWECAATFGAARLRSPRTGATFEAVALGAGHSWQPYHAREDLLWVRWYHGKAGREPALPGSRTRDSSLSHAPNRRARATERSSRGGSYRFRPTSMLHLMTALANAKTPLSDERGMTIVTAQTVRTYSEYCRFLSAAGLATRSANVLTSTDTLGTMIAALRQLDFDRIRTLLSRVPSFRHFLTSLDNASPIRRGQSYAHARIFSGYSAFAEMCCAGIRFDRDTIYATSENPVPEVFVEAALTAYDAVRDGEAFAVTGRWLEFLARERHIHPVRARQRLAEATQAGLVNRLIEGSTPETRYPERRFHLLEVKEAKPTLREINLYHGDFLHPGQSATSLRLLRVN